MSTLQKTQSIRSHLNIVIDGMTQDELLEIGRQLNALSYTPNISLYKTLPIHGNILNARLDLAQATSDLGHIATHRIAHPEVTLVSSDREILTSEYVDEDSRIDPLSVGQLFSQGATVIFTHLHRRVQSLARLAVDLQGACSAPIQTNVYLTPSGAQGFPPHWDTHDVFVLQVFGRKKWTIYDTKIALPLRGQSFDHELHHAGAVTAEFELAAGDLAYIPRGLIHSAKSSDEPSLHVTVGVLAMTWAELLL